MNTGGVLGTWHAVRALSCMDVFSECEFRETAGLQCEASTTLLVSFLMPPAARLCQHCCASTCTGPPLPSRRACKQSLVPLLTLVWRFIAWPFPTDACSLVLRSQLQAACCCACMLDCTPHPTAQPPTSSTLGIPAGAGHAARRPGLQCDPLFCTLAGAPTRELQVRSPMLAMARRRQPCTASRTTHGCPAGGAARVSRRSSQARPKSPASQLRRTLLGVAGEEETWVGWVGWARHPAAPPLLLTRREA